MSRSLSDHFSSLEDPRQPGKIMYPLSEILMIVLCATLAGADNFMEIEQWAKAKIDFLRRLLPFKKGIPSHDTLNDVMNALPHKAFSKCFRSWVASLHKLIPDFIAVDGKTSRRAHNKDNGQPPLHLVSAWASRQRLVLGQQACEAKSNEITAIPQLLELLELAGALVTIDAMGCQTDIARLIREKGGDYLLALKKNWPRFYEKVELYFNTCQEDQVQRYETLDKGHGREVVRSHTVCHDVQWLLSDKRFPGEWKFKDLAMIAKVETTSHRKSGTSTEIRYYISSSMLSAKEFAQAVRSHWHVENKLHWVLDMVFYDDYMRLRTNHGPANMATIRHFAINLIQGINDKNSLKVRRKKLGWDEDYLVQAITVSPCP